MPGLSSVKDFDTLFRGFDLLEIKHSGQGCSTLKFFAPKAYNSGFRLQSHSKDIWAVFSKTFEKYKQPYLALEISTEIFFIYSMHLFKKIAEQDNEDFLLTTQILEDAMTPEIEKLIFDYIQTVIDYS